MSGIDRTSGFMGASQATRARSNLGSIGQTAFSLAGGVATAAAGAAAGPLAGAAVGAAVDGMRTSISSDGGSGSGSAINKLTDEANKGTVDMEDKAAANMKAAQQNQMDMFFLQQAVNSQSQTYNTLSNVQKSKHDAAMAAIQNTR